MSDVYSLTITPSRGFVYSLAPSFKNKYFPVHTPTSFSGVRVLGPVFQSPPGLDSSFNQRYFEFSNNTNIVSNGGSSKSPLRMNNTNPSEVTRIGFNTNNNGIFSQLVSTQSRTFTPKGRFTIASLNSNSITQWSIYYITDISISDETHRFYNITVEYVGGTATNYNGNPVAFRINEFGGSGFSYLPSFIGTPTNPWGITGSKDAINTFLQNESFINWQWSDFPTGFEVTNDAVSVRLISLFATSNKSPVDLTYSLTKNGVSLNNYVHSLVYETKENLDNPYGY
jgi:hypothetical protein